VAKELKIKKLTKERFFKNYMSVTDMQNFGRLGKEKMLKIVKEAFFDYNMDGLKDIEKFGAEHQSVKKMIHFKNKSGLEYESIKSFYRFGFKLRETYELEKSVFKYGGIGFIQAQNKKQKSDGAIDFLFERGAIYVGGTYFKNSEHISVKNGVIISVKREL